MVKKRIDWIDQLKGIGFFFVILGHTAGISSVLKSWIYSFHMPLYFIAGGFHFNFEKVYKTSFKDHFIKTFKGLIVPYFWLNFFCITIRYVIVFFFTHTPLNIPGYLRGILISNTRVEASPSPSGPTYFILLIALSRLALWFVVRALKADKAKIGLFCVLFACVSIATKGIDLPWHLNVVPTAMLLTYIGRIMMEFYLDNKEKIHSMAKIKSLALATGLIAVGFIMWRINGRVSFHANKYGEDYVLYLVGALSTVIGIALITMLLPAIKPITYLGANTLFAVAIHDPIIRLLETAFKQYDEALWFALLQTVFIFLLLIPMGFLVNRFMPFINGKPTKTKGIVTALFGILSVIIAGFGPYNFLINRYDGDFAAYKPLAYTGYIFICVAVYFISDKMLPFMFNKEKTAVSEKRS